jgi:hypothetical protein
VERTTASILSGGAMPELAGDSQEGEATASAILVARARARVRPSEREWGA